MTALESSYRIEPCHLTSIPGGLADVIGELIGASSRLGSRLHPTTAASMRELVAVMNCYYSNLIEGHNTRPRDIERALAENWSDDSRRRDLQLEARAHIRVQRELDGRHRRGELGEPTCREFVRFVHRAFYEDAPDSMLQIDGSHGVFQMVPGEFRNSPEQDNAVGRHLPPSSARVEEFMAYLEQQYRLSAGGPVRAIVAMAASHHRLNYIHPFPDGNGRVSRLVSHAMALQAGIGAGGLWSISRGLARGLTDRGDYKRMMDAADSPRQGDLDGRGNLSLRALVEFVTWFVRVALDQVNFMAELFDFEGLTQRLKIYAATELKAPAGVGELLAEVFRRGAVPRGEVGRILGRSDRAARDQLKRLTQSGVLVSETPKGPVSLHFTIDAAESLFPKLYPAQSK